jgi:hypothetical protein
MYKSKIHILRYETFKFTVTLTNRRPTDVQCWQIKHVIREIKKCWFRFDEYQE